MRVLVVEDERRLAEIVATALREGAGFAVDVAEDGELALQLAGYGHYDLIVLDLMLPKVDGAGVLKRLRGRSDRTPVLMLTARVEKKWVIEMLNLGADDYLAKPFDLGELLARVKALVRRGKGVATPVLRVRDLELNTLEQTVTRGGVELELSPAEYRILEYLLHKPRVVVSKRELLEHMYDYNWERHSNVIEAHVSNLRRKLEAGTAEGEERGYIQTLRGRGYRLQTDGAAAAGEATQ